MNFTAMLEGSYVSRVRARYHKIIDILENIPTKKLRYPARTKRLISQLKVVSNAQLDYYTLTGTFDTWLFPNPEAQLKRYFGSNKDILEKYSFGSNSKKELSEAWSKTMQHFKDNSRDAARWDKINRIICESLDAYHNDDFIIFNTLTVADENMNSVFGINKDAEWKGYLRHWERKTKNHRYFAVVERGEKTGRLHIHVMHFFSDATFDLSCPNKDFKKGIRRQLESVRKFWDNGARGHCTPYIVRYGELDAWSRRANHRWPNKYCKKTKAVIPIETSKPEQLARYMSKYLTKEVDTPWKIRVSQEFGMRLMKAALEKMDNRQLLIAVENSKIIVQKLWLKIPWNPTRFHKMATKIFMTRIKNNVQLLSIIWSQVEPQESLPKQLQTLMKKTPNPSLPNYGSSIPRFWENAEVSDICMYLENFIDHHWWKPSQQVKGSNNEITPPAHIV